MTRHPASKRLAAALAAGLAVSALAALMSCGGSESEVADDTPASTASATALPEATATAVATDTPKPTNTAAATNTPVPATATPTTRPPTVAPAATATPSRAGCSAAYPTVCIPPPPPDLDCKDVGFKRFQVLPPDPHGFDADHDGIGCES